MDQEEEEVSLPPCVWGLVSATLGVVFLVLPTIPIVSSLGFACFLIFHSLPEQPYTLYIIHSDNTTNRTWELL